MTALPTRRPFVRDPWTTARTHGDDPAVVGTRTISWSDLARTADLAGAGLAELGVPDGAVVSTSIPPGPEFFALALACLRYGYGLLPVEQRLLDSPSGGTLLAGAGVVLHLWDTGRAVPQGIAAAPYSDLLAAGARRHPPGSARRAGFLCFVTSGTTGDPAAVVRSRPWYPYKGVAVFERYAAGPGNGPHVMANPAFHLGTVGPALYALQAGSAVVVLAEWSPHALGAAVDEHGADSLFVSAGQLLEIVAEGTWPGRKPAVVLHGGSSCAPSVKRAAIDILGPVLHEFYGTSAGVISEISTPEWLRRPGSVGKPLPGVGVSVRRDGLPVAPGEMGEISVLPRAVDRSGTVERPVGIGDLGRVDQDGYLYVIGRLTEPDHEHVAVLESAIRTLDGVGDALVQAVPGSGSGRQVDCRVEAIRLDALQNLDRDILAAADAQGLSVGELDIRLVGGHDRTASGKLSYTGSTRRSRA